MCAAKILFKLTGSIAAWKVCAVISRLVQDGHDVQTVATASALKFIGAATLEGMTGRPVRSDLWERGGAMEHINLVKWADLVILCPATANTLNRLAAGLADDFVGALFLAHDRRKPYLVAPAMNPSMWAHPATTAAIETLRGWGLQVLPVARGRMACGDEGEGRLIEPEDILAAIRAALAGDRSNAAATSAGLRRRVLVTAGGTEEPVDGVRSLTNFSTGRTGALIAEQLSAAGHEVTLLRSHRAAPATAGVHTETFVTFTELRDALERLLGSHEYDCVVHAAAVGDYAVAGLTVNGEDIASGAGKIGTNRDVILRLKPNPKLIDYLRGWSRNRAVRVVGFKLTRGASPDEARAAVGKLFAHSGADAVVHNDLEAISAVGAPFPATLWRPDRPQEALPSREAIGHALARFVSEPQAHS